MKRLLWLSTIIALAVIVRAAAVAALAQTPPSNVLQFEVASVKPGLSPAELGAQARVTGSNSVSFTMPQMGIQALPGGRFTASTVTLKQLIAHAFQVRDYQIDGGPPWLTSSYFEINALAGADATPDDIAAMLRALLAERFSLRTRIETRRAPVYALTVARSDGRLGSALTRTTPECEQLIDARAAGTAPRAAPLAAPSLREFPTTPTCGMIRAMNRADGASVMLYGGFEITSLVSHVSSELSAPAADRTGLAGRFDIRLEYASERPRGGRPPGLDTNSTEVPPPPLAVALQQQLGLRLEKEVGPLDIVIIDAAEPPTPD